MIEYVCEICLKNFGNSKSHLEMHKNKKYPCIPTKFTLLKNTQVCVEIVPQKNDGKNMNNLEANRDDNFPCEYCKKDFTRKFNLDRHIPTCKVKKEKEAVKVDLLKQKDYVINEQKNIINKIEKKFNDIVETIVEKNIKILKGDFTSKSSHLINDKLINTIIEKDKQLEKMDKVIKSTSMKQIDDFIIKSIDNFDNLDNLDKLYDMIEQNNKNNKNDKDNLNSCFYSVSDKIESNKIESNIFELVIDKITIKSNKEDGYIGSVQMCKASGVKDKKLSHWIDLDSTKELIKILVDSLKINESNLIYKTKEGLLGKETWIHPDLAIQLVHWLGNKKFAFQISHWIRNMNGKNNIDSYLKVLKDKETLIKNQKSRIKLLENMILKRHKRNEFPDINVVYLITCNELKVQSKYIIGKTIDLKERLSSYDKMSKYEAVYYKSFATIKQMELAEKIILEKLDTYREQANIDSFILPVGKNIKLFTKIFDEADDFFNKSIENSDSSNSSDSSDDSNDVDSDALIIL